MSIEIFDSRDPEYRSPFGAVPTNCPVTFRLRFPKSSPYIHPCLLIFQADQWNTPQVIPLYFEQGSLTYNVYAASYSCSNPALLFYCFRTYENNREVYICKGQNNATVTQNYRGDLWQLTVYEREYETPAFLKGGLIYQIFPDRFYNSGAPKKEVPADRTLKPWGSPPEYRPNEQGEVTNSDYMGGDLRGIEEKLDYLQGLGVTAIYLNPIFEAHSNHRYNTADYRKIDPLLGTEKDFQRLCRKAKKAGISIILDGVFSHTGSDSVYFNRKNRYSDLGAYQSTESPYYSWYQFDSFPDRYRSWWGFQTLPEVNESSPEYDAFICGEEGVLHKWMSLGASGFRLDVADELPDAFLDHIAARIKAEDPQAVVLGEVWEDASNKSSYGVRRRYLLGKQLDSVMNYPFKDAILAYIRYGDGQGFYNTVMSILENYPPQVAAVLMNSLSTHDTERAITALGGEPSEFHDREWQAARQTLSPDQYKMGKQLFLLCCVLQYTITGTPCLYYGDEIGMTGYKDPFNRCCFDWEKQDEEVLEHLRTLGKLRMRYRELFAEGEFLPLCFDQDLCVYARKYKEQYIITAVNRSPYLQAIQIPKIVGKYHMIYGSMSHNQEIKPMQFAIFYGEATS